MVTNLPEKAKAQWKRVVMAKDLELKLMELLKFYSMIPKHKGTKNLVKQVKRQIIKLREEIERRKKRRHAQSIDLWSKEKHGVARISLLGADYYKIKIVYEYFTGKQLDKEMWSHDPIYGVMTIDGVQFQVIYLPPLFISEPLNYKIINFCKTSDLIFLCSNFEDSIIEDILNLSKKYGLSLKKAPPVHLMMKDSKGIMVSSKYRGHNIKNPLNNYGIRNIHITLLGKGVSDDGLEEALIKNIQYIRTYVVNISNNRCCLWDFNKYYYFSNMQKLCSFLLDELGLIKIYTRNKMGQVADKPIILKRGSTVIDLAEMIHSDLKSNFKYALIKRDNEVIKVSRKFMLNNDDIVEIRANY